MRRFRPQLYPTLFTLAVVALCASLGVWQVQRLYWKRGLIEQRAAALAAPPAAVPRNAAATEPLDLHRVTDRGVFLNDAEIEVHAIGPHGAAGFDVLTPLREPAGRIVFVNRGFVPTELKRAPGGPTGEVEIAGRLRLPPEAKPGWFIPENRPGDNEWFWIDLPTMGVADGLANVAPFYVDADATPNPGGWPKGGTALPELPNDHLQYAITWFSLAVAAIVIYVLSQREDRNKGDDRLPRT
ncbi:MAG TPA: SURF1 family protein [Stellaceae bacterium]|jgi:surfeit locus 1 family protein|nr:SURF1 family protein [Stellaceae bacterium]